MPKRSTKKKTARKAPQNSGQISGKQPIALLRPDPKNARKISKQALAGLGVSMTSSATSPVSRGTRSSATWWLGTSG
jgi:hypothetical protein